MDDVHVWRVRARGRLSDLGMTVGDFSRLTHIPEHQLFGFFFDGRPPSIQVAGGIAEGLGVSLDWLLGINEPRTRPIKATLGDTDYYQVEGPL